jgi:four helix bundle protein
MGNGMTRNLIIYEKTLEMIEYGTIALRQFPRYEKFVLAAMIRQQMYQVLKLIVETNKRTHRKTALTELDIAHETLRHLVDLSYRRLKYFDHKKYTLLMERINEVGKLLGGWIRSQREGAQPVKYAQ